MLQSVISRMAALIPVPARRAITRHASVQQILKRIPGRGGFIEYTLRTKLGSDVTFLQIGAHYAADDKLRLLAIERGWRGILIEANPLAFAKLRTNYANVDKFTLINRAVADTCGSVPFYYLPDDVCASLGLPHWADQISSLDKKHLIHHFGPEIASHIQEATVAAGHLQSIMGSLNVRRVDLVHIDTEGFDAKVVRQIDFSIPPKIIVYETSHLSIENRESTCDFLRRRGYRVIPHPGDSLAIYNGPSV
jgi:FkbM family methyltransferase